MAIRLPFRRSSLLRLAASLPAHFRMNNLRHARRGGERECRQPRARRAAQDAVMARVQRMASIGGRRRSRQRGPIGGARRGAARGQVAWERIRARPQRARASAGGHAPRKARRGGAQRAEPHAARGFADTPTPKTPRRFPQKRETLGDDIYLSAWALPLILRGKTKLVQRIQASCMPRSSNSCNKVDASDVRASRRLVGTVARVRRTFSLRDLCQEHSPHDGERH